MRLFIAAELPEEVCEALGETSALLRERVRGRYVAPDSYHLTLAFLGEVPGTLVPLACTLLDDVCYGQPPIEMALGPFGLFGRRCKAALWQGLSRGMEELTGLAGDIRECLAAAGLPFDETAFVPHVTLMRAADLERGQLPMPSMERGVIEFVTLFSSDLSGERPHYEPLHRVRLEAAVESEPEDEGINRLWK